MDTKTTDQENPLRLERTFECTPERLFEAWTDPVQYARWLNPDPGHDLIIHEWDPRPGGRVRFDMPQGDGNQNPQSGVFHEIDPPRRLVTGEPDRSFLIEASFDPVGEGRTRLVVAVTGLPLDWHAPAIKGWNAGFDKLEALLKETAPAIETRSITLERTFDCTPEALWDAWTKPELLAKWFGPFPEGEVMELDLRPGGGFRLAMIDEQGERYPVWGEYKEVQAPNRLVFTAKALEIGKQVSTVTLEIEPSGPRTLLRFRQDGIPAQVAEGTGEGWRMAWDKLCVLVAEDRSVVISRLIDAPRERVWDAFTMADQVVKWWGPTGFTTTTKEMDVRPGGRWVFTMHGPDGTDFANWILYEEVLRHERLAYAHGDNLGEDPWFHATTTFYEQGKKTLVTLRSVFPSKQARDEVVTRYRAIEGGNQTLARLADHVEEVAK